MAAVTIEQITEELRHLPAEKLAVVYDFVGYLRQRTSPTADLMSEAAWLAEAGMADYLAELQNYEDRLARGEVSWG